MANTGKPSKTRLLFGKRVRMFRKLKGWSQEELAERSGLHRNYVGGVERGQRNIAIDNMEVLSKSLGHDLAEFLTD